MVSTHGRSPGRIVYAGFATRHHSGGVHVMTQHVRLLRERGHEAWLWLPDPDDRTDWIADDVPMVFGASTPIGADDLLVLPETPTVHGSDPAPGARKVIFNQNHFYTFAAGAPGDDFPGWTPAPAIWVVSAESRDVLSAALPGLQVSVVPNPIDGELFAPGTAEQLRVSWFPKKRPREGSLLKRLLADEPRLAGVELVELIQAPRAEVAATLGSSAVFIALGHTESFGLPVAEALASGCLVVGYDGGGGHELFEAPGAWRVPDQRPLLIRDQVASLIQDLDALASVRAANRRWVLDRYPFARTGTALQEAVAAAWARPGSDAVAVHPVAWLDTLGPHFTAYA
ncbi:glycosyltransferase involved in cell wall biosynthesis [Arthrobacter sp. PL16]|uniref:glycosyltransferase n=1 Tax=Arthrobacter sp. PL16 TaxID=3071720 RepID=UPI002DFB0CAA|nr:glycosyltransferase involved in cell wall biosynthesis [Arthrobacter sp. PL16]